MNTNTDDVIWIQNTPSYTTTSIYEYNHCIADINFHLMNASKNGDLHTVKYLINNKREMNQ